MLSFPAFFSGPKWWAALLVVAASFHGSASTSMAQFGDRLISPRMARQQGLERAWFSHVELDPSHNRVVRWILDGDQLFILTSAGVLQTIDAHTGRTMWVTPIGNPDFPSLGPAANQDLVALVNGSTLYVLDRRTGRPLDEWRLGGAPGAGPALTPHYVFVPLATGRMEAYPLDEEGDSPWYYQSSGRALVTPLATPDSVVWTTDKGQIYVAGVNPPYVRYRVETPTEFLAPPARHGKIVYIISQFGDLFAIDEQTGSRLWKYGTGYLTDRAPAVVDDRVYVSSQQPALHCVDADTGRGIWETAGAEQFAAASDKRVYGVDRYGTVLVLDAATGNPIGRMPTGGRCSALVNDQTDRLYLLSDDGIVQCLHEIGQSEPIYHNQGAAAATEPPPKTSQEMKPSEGRSTHDEAAAPHGPPAQQSGPSNSGQPGFDVENPFGGSGKEGAQKPSDEKKKPAEENPFGVEEDPFAS
jgi:outer membrane protein assembly factor BamB